MATPDFHGARVLALESRRAPEIAALISTFGGRCLSAPAVKRNVKRSRGGQMVLRWVAAGMLEAVKGFRRLKGYADMPKLVAALRARDHQLRLAASVENVA